LVLPGSQLVRLPNQDNQDDGTAAAFDGTAAAFDGTAAAFDGKSSLLTSYFSPFIGWV